MFKHNILKYFYALGFLILLLLKVDLIYLIIYGFVLFISVTLGAFNIRFNYFLKTHHQQNTTNKVIAITFDDGPTEFTPRILDLLENHQAKATFFCIGNKVEQLPEIVKNIDKKGHTVANHSFLHSNSIGFFSTKRLLEEIINTEKSIFKVISKKTNLYRPPFGVTNPNIARAIKKLNYEVIGWNIRSLDTVIKDEEKLFNRVYSKIKPGSILLLHDTSEVTIVVLERLLTKLEQENYTFVTVNEMLSLPAYKN